MANVMILKSSAFVLRQSHVASPVLLQLIHLLYFTIIIIIVFFFNNSICSRAKFRRGRRGRERYICKERECWIMRKNTHTHTHTHPITDKKHTNGPRFFSLRSLPTCLFACQQRRSLDLYLCNYEKNVWIDALRYLEERRVPTVLVCA